MFLMPTGRKKRATAGPPGDAEAQVRARRSFFDGGHYDRVLDAAADAVVTGLGHAAAAADRPPATRTVLDAGCGEGSYLCALASALAPPRPASPVALLGVDVSKPAIRLAAARLKAAARLAVASSFVLPLGRASVDALLVAMAPLPPEAEVRRVLKPGGCVVVVRPAPRHLDGLKRAVYGGRARFDGEEEDEDEARQPGGRRVDRARVSFDLALDGPAAAALLTMTPFLFSSGRDMASGWAQQRGVVLETGVDVFVERFEF